ncbi:hypothetical protein K469DRAFT_785604, partial [Zopfia rhizophila CBS 207.26]
RFIVYPLRVPGYTSFVTKSLEPAARVRTAQFLKIPTAHKTRGLEALPVELLNHVATFLPTPSLFELRPFHEYWEVAFLLPSGSGVRSSPKAPSFLMYRI